MTFFGGAGSRPWQTGDALSPEGTRGNSPTQGSEASNATIVPQSDVVVGMTRREDELNPVPGNAAGTATLGCRREHKKG